MNTLAGRNLPTRTRKSTLWLSILLLSVPVLLICLGSYASAAQERDQEVVVNLAAGHVAIYVAKDAMIVGGSSERVEPESRPPLIFPLGGRRVGVLLGAAEWLSPSGSLTPVRLDRELPSLSFETPGPHMRGAPDLSGQASDIEVIGVALLERLRALAERLHHKISLEPEEPLVELLIVNFQRGYGPEIWLLRYRVAQEALRGEYWRTRVLRPSYTQLFPPEKGQPRTLVEVHYPTEGKTLALLDLLKRNDSRLAGIRNADPKIARAAERLMQGESQKSPPDDAANFLRAALDATASPEAKVVLGVLNEQRGFEWILAPPEPPQKTDPTKPREPGAPTLRKPP